MPSSRRNEVVQAPVSSAFTVDNDVEPDETRIVAPGSAVPVTFTVAFAVVVPVDGDVILAAGGAAVSTLIAIDSETSETLPAASVAVAQTACWPSASAVVVIDQALLASACAVPIGAPLS